MKLAPIDAKVELSFHPRWMFKTFEEVKTLRAPLNSSPGGGKDKDAPFVPSFFKAFLTFSFFFFFRCPVGTYWHFHGERCNELVSLPVDPPLIATCLVGSLCLVCAVIGILIFVNKKCSDGTKTVAVV